MDYELRKKMIAYLERHLSKDDAFYLSERLAFIAREHYERENEDGSARRLQGAC